MGEIMLSSYRCRLRLESLGLCLSVFLFLLLPFPLSSSFPSCFPLFRVMSNAWSSRGTPQWFVEGGAPPGVTREDYRGHWFSLAPSCLAAGEEVINGFCPVPLLKASTRPLWERCPALEERNKTRNHQEEPGQAGLADICQL